MRAATVLKHSGGTATNITLGTGQSVTMANNFIAKSGKHGGERCTGGGARALHVSCLRVWPPAGADRPLLPPPPRAAGPVVNGVARGCYIYTPHMRLLVAMGNSTLGSWLNVAIQVRWAGGGGVHLLRGRTLLPATARQLTSLPLPPRPPPSLSPRRPRVQVNKPLTMPVTGVLGSTYYPPVATPAKPLGATMSAASLARRKVKALRKRGVKAWSAAAGDSLHGSMSFVPAAAGAKAAAG